MDVSTTPEELNSPAAAVTAPVQEVFSSIQGEGPYVGRRQVFVRFAHCHLKCTYCDTPMTTPDGQAHIEPVPGGGKTQRLANPLTPDDLMGVLASLLPKARHHSVSFTGGEPLLYHRFLKAIFPRVQGYVPTYLETSGTQPDFLAPILPWTDMIAMDIKLPSATGERAYYEEHRAFLDLAATRPETTVFIKLVMNDAVTDEELTAVLTVLRGHEHLPVIIQPVTSLTDKRVYVKPERLFAVEQRLSESLSDVRIIPQTHKMLNVL